jgi:hypothetical protein
MHSGVNAGFESWGRQPLSTVPESEQWAWLGKVFTNADGKHMEDMWNDNDNDRWAVGDTVDSTNNKPLYFISTMEKPFQYMWAYLNKKFADDFDDEYLQAKDYLNSAENVGGDVKDMAEAVSVEARTVNSSTRSMSSDADSQAEEVIEKRDVFFGEFDDLEADVAALDAEATGDATDTIAEMNADLAEDMAAVSGYTNNLIELMDELEDPIKTAMSYDFDGDASTSEGLELLGDLLEGVIGDVTGVRNTFQAQLVDVGDLTAAGPEALQEFKELSMQSYEGLRDTSSAILDEMNERNAELNSQAMQAESSREEALNGAQQSVENAEKLLQKATDDLVAFADDSEATVDERRAAAQDLLKEANEAIDLATGIADVNIQHALDLSNNVENELPSIGIAREDSADALLDAGREYLDEVNVQGRTSRSSWKTNFTNGLANAEALAQAKQDAEEGLYIDNATATLNSADRRIYSGKDMVDIIAHSMRDRHKEMDDFLRRRKKDLIRKEASLNRKMNSAIDKWDQYTVGEKIRASDFSHTISRRSQEYQSKLDSTADLLKKANQRHHEKLQDSKRIAKDEVNHKQKDASSDLTLIGRQLHRQVELNEITMLPEELQGKASALLSAESGLKSTVQSLGQAVYTKYSGANGIENMLHAADINSAADIQLIWNDIAGLLGKAFTYVDGVLSGVEQRQNNVIDHVNETQRTWFNDMTDRADQVNTNLTTLADKFRTALNGNLTTLDQVLVALELAARPVANASYFLDRALSQRFADLSHASGAHAFRINQYQHDADKKLEKASNEMSTNQSQQEDALARVGEFLEDRVDKLVAQYVNGSGKAHGVYDLFRQQEDGAANASFPALFADHLAEVRDTEAGEEAAAEKKERSIDEEADANFAAITMAAQEAQNKIVEMSSDATFTYVQNAGADALASVEKEESEDGHLTDEAKTRLSSWAADFDGAFSLFQNVSRVGSDNATATVLQLQSETRNEQRIDEKFGEEVKAAVRGLRQQGSEEEATFLAALGQVGQILASGSAEDRSVLDQEVADLSSFFTETVVGNISDAKDDFMHKYNSLLAMLGEEPISEKIGQAGILLANYEGDVAAKQSWTTTELQSSAESQQQKVQTHLRADVKSVVSSLEKKKKAFVVKTQDAVEDTDKVFGKLDDAQTEMIAMKNRTVAEINFSKQKLQLDRTELEKQVGDILDLGRYQEEYLISNLTEHIKGAFEEVTAEMFDCAHYLSICVVQ